MKQTRETRAFLSAFLVVTFWSGISAAGADVPSAEPANPKPVDARAYFRLAGIDDSQFARLTDGAPWGSGEDELLWKVLYRQRDFSDENRDAWRRRSFNADEVRTDPDEARGRFFGLHGRATLVEPVSPPKEVVRKYGFERYYRCHLVLEPSGTHAVVFARTIPSGLEIGKPIDAETAAVGCFLKWGVTEEGRPEAVFAADRLAWFPNTPLGRLGFDAGLLDALNDKKSLLASERECFYQLLDAVGRAEPGSLLREATAELRESGRKQFSVIPLFKDPAAQRGKLFAFTGTVRRAIRVVVEDPDVVRRFGIHEYYEIALFTDDSQGNPIFFCVRNVPPEMPLGEGSDYAQTVRVAGFFLKNWAFHSQYATQAAAEADDSGVVPRQLAPLLIGKEPVWLQTPVKSPSAVWGLGGGLGFLLALLVIWLVLRRLAKTDRRRDRARLYEMAGETGEIEIKEPDQAPEESED